MHIDISEYIILKTPALNLFYGCGSPGLDYTA